MRRHTLPALALAVVGLASASLLVPGAASAEPHAYWPTARTQHATTAAKVASTDLDWTVLNHEIIVTTSTVVVIPFVYTCGTKADPKPLEVRPGAFQKDYADPEYNAQALTSQDGPLPVFTCDGTQHVQDVVLTEVAGAFEYGTVEIGLFQVNDSSWTFEHTIVGYGVRDGKVPVTATVNASPEPVKVGKTITVKGTVKRKGKAYGGVRATLYFQADGSSAVKVGGDRASSHGKLKTTVRATRSGSYFWTTSATDKIRAGASYADHVEVTR